MKRRLLRSLTLLLASGLSLAANAADLTVSAAASLTNAFRELGPMFEAAHPGVSVHFNFAASGVLLQQITRGAPVDVFASADQETMDQAQSRGLVQAGQRRDFASNTLVVIVPVSSVQVPKSIADLAQGPYARIAIGQPASVPVGRYTRDTLEAAGLWSPIEAKMIGATNVRQALDYVARAEVDAGFVYASDAALMPDKVKVALSVPTSRPIRYPVAPLVAAPQAELARGFVDFLATAPARAVLSKYGFGQP